MKAREILGRDVEPGEWGAQVIAQAISGSRVPIIGTCACVPQESSWRARLFCKIRNFLLQRCWIKGYNGILFINKVAFNQIGGYDEKRDTFEHIDLIKRALKVGARWVFVEDIFVAISMRRYEHQGYLKTLWWWTIEATRYKLGLPSRKLVPASKFKKE